MKSKRPRRAAQASKLPRASRRPPAVAEPLERRRLFATVNWVANGSGDFNVGANWSTGAVPGPNDDAVINAPAGSVITVAQGDTVRSVNSNDLIQVTGTLQMNAASNLNAGVQMQSGNLLAGGDLTLGGASEFTGGAIRPDANVTVTNNGTLTLDDGGDATLASFNFSEADGARLLNNGTIAKTAGGNFVIDDGISLVNAAGATFDFQVDAAVIHGSGDAASFVNRGTLTKTGGGGASTINVGFSNKAGATIAVATGTVVLAATGGVSTGGTFDVATGAILDLTGNQSVEYTGTYTGSGGGTVLLQNGDLLVPSTGITFDFPANLFQWTGGAICPDVNTTVSNVGFIQLNDGGDATLASFNATGNGGDGAQLANTGTILKTAGGNFVLDDGITLRNAATGVFNFRVDAAIIHGAGDASTVVNHGVIRKSGGGGASSIRTLFDNTATVAANSGTFVIASTGGLNANGAYNAAPGTIIDLTGDQNVQYTGLLTGSGGGTVLLQNGSLLVPSTGLTLSFPQGYFQWTGGAIRPDVNTAVTNNGYVQLADGGDATFASFDFSEADGATVVNNGVMTKTAGGNLVIDDGITLRNTATGVFDFAVDATILRGAGDPTTVQNFGLIKKSGGGGASVIRTRFRNLSASLEVDTGTLAVAPSGGLSTGGTFTVAPGTILDLTGNQDVQYTGTLTGTGGGTVLLQNGSLLVPSTGLALNFPAGMFQWTGGAIRPDVNTAVTNLGVVNLADGGDATLASYNFSQADGAQFVNDGVVVKRAGGNFVLDDGISFVNPVGGTFRFAVDAAIIHGSGDPVSFDNRGVVRKIGGGGASSIDVPLNNVNGTIAADTGTVVLAAPGGLIDGGTFDAAAGTIIDLTGNQNVQYTGTLTGTGGGTILLQNGSLLVPSSGLTIDFPGTMFQWIGGSIRPDANTTVVNAGAIALADAGDATLASYNFSEADGARLLNNGTVTKTAGGNFVIDDGITFANGPAGTFDFGVDAAVIHGSGDPVAFDNEGTLQKSGGGGTSTVAVPLSGAGTLLASSGTIGLTGGNALAGQTVLAGGNFSGDLNIAPGGVLSGSGTISGNLVSDGNVKPGLGAALNVTGNYTSNADATFTVSLGPPAPGMFSVLNVGTAATLGGKLASAPATSGSPSSGSVYPVITAQSIAGGFVNSSAYLGGGLAAIPSTAPTANGSTLNLVVGAGSPGSIVNGAVQASGSGGADGISATIVNGQISLVVDGVTQTFPAGTPLSIDAGAGADMIVIGPGISASVNGGSGADTIVGNNGADTLVGGLGDDSVNGGGGNDSLSGGSGDDTLTGGQGDDMVVGGVGDDVLLGGTGHDTQMGGDGNDVIVSELGSDMMMGQAGNDFFLNAGGGADSLMGGTGFNVAQQDPTDAMVDIDLISDPNQPTSGTGLSPAIASLVKRDLASLRPSITVAATVALSGGVLNVTGTSGDDVVALSESNGVLSLDPGDGAIQTFAVNTVTSISVSLGDGNDVLNADNDLTVPVLADGGNGNDTLRGGAADDVLVGGAGDDVLVGRIGHDTLLGGDGADTLRGLRGPDSLDGGAGDDFLLGGTGGDTLSGGDGNDVLTPGGRTSTDGSDNGADLLIGGAGDDTANYTPRLDNLTLSADGLPHSGAAGEADVIEPDVENLLGGLGNDTITGSLLAGGFLSGGLGNDAIAGGPFNDNLVGAAGNDSVGGGAGHNGVFLRQNPADADLYIPGPTQELTDFDTADAVA